MPYKQFFILGCIFAAMLLTPSSYACTTFCLDSDDNLVVGKNFDWPIGDALLVVNKRNVTKTAYFWTGEQTAVWTSKYGSVTFNPHGAEHPFSGMNEVGLVVSAMGLSASIYQAPDSRPVISALQWIQYQLDNAATVAQVISSDLDLRISNDDQMTLHFLVCDSTGTCATIEFIDGELVYHTQETMPVKVLANSMYSSDLEHWEKGEIPEDDWSTTERFFTAAQMLEDYDSAVSGPAIDYTFDILSNLTWWIDTQWSIAYDIQNQRINFHTFGNENRRYVDLSSFDFSCSTPVKVLDVQQDLSGDISDNFIDYTYEINRDLIEKAYAGYDVSDQFLDAIAGCPETTVCSEVCELDIKYRKIKSKKLTKSRKRMLRITGGEGFNPYDGIDLGPLTWQKMFFNERKNRLRILAIVPEGLAPGIIPIRVGECFGEIEIH